VSGALGLAVLVVLALIAVVGPLLAPEHASELIGAPGASPSADAWLGTDYLGRDVLSRVLYGGLSVFVLGAVSVALTYTVGVSLGLVAGYSRTLLDPAIMRIVDVLLSVPAIIVLLLLATGLGTSVTVLVFGVVLVLFPGLTRIVRTATLEVATRSYVEAAVARGEPTIRTLRRDVLPNISPILFADIGIRFGWAVIIIASMNFLGLGLKPPAADWGIMISENRQMLAINPWSVLAPAVALALLTISVSLVADAYSRSTGRSAATTAHGARRPVSTPDPAAFAESVRD
jgi:ABC-type dipeptide/oligopeptide/nickel transport system permease subunit